MKRHYILGTFVLLATFLLSSCSRFNTISVEKRHYRNGFYVHHSTTPEKTENAVTTTTPEFPAQQATAAQPVANAPENNAPVSAKQTTVKQALSSAILPAKKTMHTTASATTTVAKEEKPVKRMNVRDKITSVVHREKPSAPQGDTDTAILVLLAILLPPIAVFLKEGATNRFWIDLICWLIGIGGFWFIFYSGAFWLFAVIFAILIVLDAI